LGGRSVELNKTQARSQSHSSTTEPPSHLLLLSIQSIYILLKDSNSEKGARTHLRDLKKEGKEERRAASSSNDDVEGG